MKDKEGVFDLYSYCDTANFETVLFNCVNSGSDSYGFAIAYNNKEEVHLIKAIKDSLFFHKVIDLSNDSLLIEKLSQIKLFISEKFLAQCKNSHSLHENSVFFLRKDGQKIMVMSIDNRIKESLFENYKEDLSYVYKLAIEFDQKYKTNR